MRALTLLSALIICILISGCSSPKYLAQKNTFTFSIDENQYQIISLNTKSGEGTNYLTMIDEKGRKKLNARDLNQDGILDVVLLGNITLEEADEIYKTGIIAAKSDGHYKERTSLRSYEYIKGDTILTLRSYSFNDPKVLSNLFTIYQQLTGIEMIFLDSDADGKLDSIEKGTMNLDHANLLYKEIIQEGLEKNRISLNNGRFIVKEISYLHNASAFYKNN